MIGIDLSRYQTVTDPAAVARSGIRFAWVKGTDGGGPAPVQRADRQVGQMREAGVPVGLYHYAQLSPSPEQQADVLTAEVYRLGAYEVPPALDLEDPHRPGTAAADFARRFLLRLWVNGFERAVLYGNTSMLTGIDAEAIRRDIPDTVIWAASYGPNDGTKYPANYRGWVDVHQYTSVGTVPGISGRVDLNYTANLDWIGGTHVALTRDDAKLVAEEVWERLAWPLSGDGAPNKMWVWLVGANMGAWKDDFTEEDRRALVSELTARTDENTTKILTALAGGGADPEELAEALAAKLGPELGTQVTIALGRKLTE